MTDAPDPAAAGFDPANAWRRPPRRSRWRSTPAIWPAASLSIWRKGRLAEATALGLADIAANRPMARDTLFRIASMTKPVTSVAALMLLEDGVWSLADPISRWAPEFADMPVLRRPDGPLDDTVAAPRGRSPWRTFSPTARVSPTASPRWDPSPTPTRRRWATSAHRGHAGGRLDEGARRPAAHLSAGRTVPLQPLHRRAGRVWSAALRASASATSCSSGSSVRSAWSTPTSAFPPRSAAGPPPSIAANRASPWSRSSFRRATRRRDSAAAAGA